jgi:hypothetical protein
VNGSGFVNGSVIRWNGASRTTNFLGSWLLQATIPASDLSAAGTAQITVFSPGPGGGTSAPVTFSIASANPTLTVNATNVVGGTDVTVTLTNGFGGLLDWLALAYTGTPDTAYVQYVYVGVGVTTRTWTVKMPTSGGVFEFRLFLNNGYTRAATSPAVTVTPPPNPVPVLTFLSPNSVTAGAASVSLTVNGSGLLGSSVVRWNGVNRFTTYVSPTQLIASIPASDVAAAGSAQVTVFSPSPGGGTSTALTFAINPRP